MKKKRFRIKGVLTRPERRLVKRKKKEFFLSPILQKRSISLSYAETGVGKTHLEIAKSLSMAAGKAFCGWKCKGKSRILYIDTEMTGGDMEEYIDLHQKALDIPDKLIKDTFITYCNDDLPEEESMPIIHGQQISKDFYLDLFKEISPEIIVIDHLTGFFGSQLGKAEDALECADFLKEIRTTTQSSVSCVHHINAQGEMYGSTHIRNVVHTIIQLIVPSGYKTEQGVRLSVRIQKGRGLNPLQKMTKEIRFENEKWSTHTHEATTKEKIKELLLKKYSLLDISNRLNKDPSTIREHRDNMIKEKKITPLQAAHTFRKSRKTGSKIKKEALKGSEKGTEMV